MRAASQPAAYSGQHQSVCLHYETSGREPTVDVGLCCFDDAIARPTARSSFVCRSCSRSCARARAGFLSNLRDRSVFWRNALQAVPAWLSLLETQLVLKNEASGSRLCEAQQYEICRVLQVRYLIMQTCVGISPSRKRMKGLEGFSLKG